MGSNFSQTQTQLGTGFADVGAGMSGYVRGFLFLMAIIFAILAFVPFSMQTGKSSNIPCDPNSPQPCLNPTESCNTTSKKCQASVGPKEKHLIFLIGTAVCILFGIIVVPMSHKIQQISHSSPGAAQALAFGEEANLAGDFIGAFRR